VKDLHARSLRDLRVSVTDRCDFRCTYCMPLVRYDWLRRDQILSFEEITRIAGIAVRLGVRKVRLTGGEPLLRTGIDTLVRQLAALPGLEAIGLTTNGSRLDELATALRDAGLTSINVSLDTLDRDRFRRITRRDRLDRVFSGIEAAQRAGFDPVKINAVIERGVNDDEILSLVDFCRERGLSLRFIEFMDVGNANGWQLDRVVPAREILARVREKHPLTPVERHLPSDPAERFRFADGTPGDLGVIASVSRPFCGNCTRARLTAEGRLVTCLFSDRGTDLRGLLRAGATDDDILETLAGVWRARSDRYSEERLEALRDARYDPAARSKFEMITLGG